jgi:hypothetical protein
VAAPVLAGGVAALEHDAPRPGRPRTITAAHVERVIRKTTRETPPQPMHWSTRSTATANAACGASGSSAG